MKKTVTLLSAAMLFSCAAFAQIPNPGFENWTAATGYDTPDGWGNLNPTTSTFAAYTCTEGTPGYGSSAHYIQLTSKTVSILGVVPGTAVSGVLTVVGTTPTIQSGFAITTRPKSLTGEWKYTPAGTDQGNVYVVLTKWNMATNSRDTVSFTNHALVGTVANFATFTFDLTYNMGSLPDSGVIVLLSGKTSGGTDGSSLGVDDLAFTGSVPTTGVATINNIDANVSVFPNPTTGVAHIAYNSKTVGSVKISINDISGRIVKEMDAAKVNGANNFNIDLSTMPSGVYFLRLTDDQGVAVKKIIVE